MTYLTKDGMAVSGILVSNYLDTLIGRVFKILPMKEQELDSLPSYIHSLLCELIGFTGLIEAMSFDASIVALLSVLTNLQDTPDCETRIVKREVFKAISICNKLKAKYASEVVR